MSDSSFDFSTIGRSASNIAAQEAAAAETAASRNTLDQEDFLKLLTTQLANQDPSQPVDNNQMVTSMAQLSVVESLSQITTGMDDIVGSISSSSALTASSLVGRSVLVDSGSAFFDGTNAITAKIDAGSGASDITISIYDSHGSVIDSYQANASQSGVIDFAWDGVIDDGSGNTTTCEPGMYKLVATGKIGDQATDLGVQTYATVSSVTLGTTLDNTKLSLLGYGDIALSDVAEIAL